MSGSDEPGRREVAHRLFAAEYDDATLQYSESDEERAPNYVVTPTGARVNRLFLVGVLTEVEQVNPEVLRARIVDPTGAFVVYAGQYQPDELAFLERTDPPAFVAVTGKARTFEPEDGDRVYTSVRPESINVVDAATRDRWVVQTAEHTLDRVATMATATAMGVAGDELTAALRERGVREDLATGILLALEHYGTGAAYLDALRTAALDAARVVADERDEVRSPDLAPDATRTEAPDVAAIAQNSPGRLVRMGETGSESDAETKAEPEIDAETEPESAPDTETGPEKEPASEPGAESEPEPEPVAGAESDVEAETGTEPDPESETEPEPRSEPDVQAGAGEDDGVTTESEDLGDFEGRSLSEGDADSSQDVSTDEMYELDEQERREIEEEYGTEFETGTEVDEPGKAEMETPEPTTAAETEEASSEPATPSESTASPASADTPESTEPIAEEPETEAGERATETDAETGTETDEETETDEKTETETDAETETDEETGTDASAADSAAAEDVTVDDVLLDTMRALDEGDGAERDAVIADVSEATGADRETIEDAIQDALMGGQCYEPSDDRLKPI